MGALRIQISQKFEPNISSCELITVYRFHRPQLLESRGRSSRSLLITLVSAVTSKAFTSKRWRLPVKRRCRHSGAPIGPGAPGLCAVCAEETELQGLCLGSRRLHDQLKVRSTLLRSDYLPVVLRKELPDATVDDANLPPITGRRPAQVALGSPPSSARLGCAISLCNAIAGAART
ncbi:hypothetical protein EVAR_13022_1 [Eumeta japonica]|uniref:Uncharacterized protein n=1 Tax=Eumeta variegata TaxID=151549 RepID=A0A4C1TWY1_EUMVA|nr:hypothetical protein EVAR_13022_1 [Eumeta japonica]